MHNPALSSPSAEAGLAQHIAAFARKIRSCLPRNKRAWVAAAAGAMPDRAPITKIDDHSHNFIARQLRQLAFSGSVVAGANVNPVPHLQDQMDWAIVFIPSALTALGRRSAVDPIERLWEEEPFL